jgi:hypothetical protein
LDGERFLKGLIPNKSKGYILLSPKNQRILSHNSKWRIIVNHKIKREEII